MLRLGEIQELKVVKKVDFGVYLAEAGGDPEEKVLLPKSQIPADLAVGGSIKCFLYKDSKDRLIATVNTPKLTLGEVGKCRVEIETNGAADLRPLAEAPFRPVFTMDYKLPSSGCEKAMRAENFTVLGPEDTVKFVAGSAEDLARAAQIIEKYALVSRCHVYFSPVFGKIDPADIVEFMIRHRMNDVRLQIQMHKVIWDPMRRGV